jgi:hypothetical protein
MAAVNTAMEMEYGPSESSTIVFINAFGSSRGSIGAGKAVTGAVVFAACEGVPPPDGV